MIKTLKNRFLLILLIFSGLIILFILPVNVVYRNKEKKAEHLSNKINAIYRSLLKDLQITSNFLNYEITNDKFFVTGESIYLNQHEEVLSNLHAKISQLDTQPYSANIDVAKKINSLETGLESYASLFDSIVYLTYKRGYKEYGLKGELAYYFQRLENTRLGLNALLRNIRYGEKDYTLKKENKHIQLVKREIEKLKLIVASSSIYTDSVKKTVNEFTNEYFKAFETIAEIDKTIGIPYNEGLKSRLNNLGATLEQNLIDLIQWSEIEQEKALSKLNLLYFTFVFVIVLLSVFFSIIISAYVGKHLEQLGRYIKELHHKKFVNTDQISLHNAPQEIKAIYAEFELMVKELLNWEEQTKKALLEAEINEKRFRELADMLPQSIYETDKWGNFTYTNKAWLENFGYTQEDINNGLNLIETIISAKPNDILGFSKLENSTFIAKRKDGTKFPASVFSNNIIRTEEFSGKRGIIIDVTERNQFISTLFKEKSKAQNADKLKSSFLANMSHEIRTPMNSILGFANLLASEGVPLKQKNEFIGYIKSSSEYLLNLIDDIIDIAKIEAGEIAIEKAACDIQALLNELYISFNELKHQFNKPELNIKLDSPNNSLVLKTDSFRLRQILTNLLTNAIKFTDKGGIKFGYTIKHQKEIEFFVKDSGIGLSRDELDIIFERFKRSNSSDKKNIAGTGLGLAISKNLVELLGGNMHVDSQPGKGTTFYFSLPYIRLEDTKTQEGEVIVRDGEESWEGKTFLIAEDNDTNFTLLNELLQNRGVNILRAFDGQEAVCKCKEHTDIDLIFMDIQMPELNGYDATREIKKIRPDIPVIAITAYAMSGDRQKTLQAGCDDYMAKPVAIDELLTIVNRHLFRKTRTKKSSHTFHDAKIKKTEKN